MTTASAPSNTQHLSLGAGGWLILDEPHPELDDQTPLELLQRGDSLPGNLRWGRTAAGTRLRGDVQTDEFDLPYAAAELRLHQLAQKAPLGEWQSVADDEIESWLREHGAACARRESGWSVTPAGHNGPELFATRSEQGVQVSIPLAEWEQPLPEETIAALSLYLCRAQTSLQFVRFRLEPRAALAVSVALADRLEQEVPAALHAVASAWRRLTREANALLDPQLAKAYRDAVEHRNQH